MYETRRPDRLRSLLTRPEGFTLAELIISIALLGLLVLVMLQAMLVMKQSVSVETGQVISRTRITRSIAFIEQTIRRNERRDGIKLYRYNGTGAAEVIKEVDKEGNYITLATTPADDTSKTLYLHYMLLSSVLDATAIKGEQEEKDHLLGMLLAICVETNDPTKVVREIKANAADTATLKEWIADNAMVLYRGSSTDRYIKSFAVSVTAGQTTGGGTGGTGGTGTTSSVDFGKGSRILLVKWELSKATGGTTQDSRNISLLL